MASFPTLRSLLPGLIAFAAAVAACSAAGDSNEFAEDGAGASQSAGATGSTEGTGTGDPIDVDAGQSGGGGPEACVAVTKKADPIPLDMNLMIDQSGSMDDDVMGGTKWSAVTSALQGFVSQSPETDGIGVGLQYFGIAGPPVMCPASCMDCNCLFTMCSCTSCSCTNNVCTCLAQGGSGSCTPADYASPEVEIAPLPGVKDAIITSLGKHSPSGGTPTRPALEGAMDHAQAWATAHPDHKVIVVLATDGLPSNGDCVPNEVTDSAAIAAGGLPLVPTFVIGVGDALTNLNQIAAAGGTGKAFLVDTGGNVQQQFIDAMNEIRDAVMACEYVIPDPGNGDQLDFDQVNVQFTPSSGPVTKVKYVGSAAGCDPTTGGWYYDDAAMPTKIFVCPVTCDLFKKDTKGQVDVLLGCKTEVN